MNTRTQRWINVLTTFALVVLLFGEWNNRKPEGVTMAIRNSRTSDVYFGAIAALDTLATKTVVAWVNASAFNANPNNIDMILEKGNPIGLTYGWYFSIGDTQNGHLGYYQRRATTAGSWKTNNGTIATGNTYMVAVTYDSTLTTNDPIFYINGASSAVTEVSTPAGAVSDDSAGHIDIGEFNDTYSAQATIFGVRIYNRILTPAEILAIYEARGVDNIINGLVFAPLMYGAAGLQSFDGVSLAAANKIVDPISGALGTAYGNPVGVAEIVLCFAP